MKRKIRYYSERSVMKRGKKDGRDWKWDPFFPFRKSNQTDPPIEQEAPSGYEKELLSCVGENFDRLSQEWSDLDKKLHRNCSDAQDRYKEAKSTHKREIGEHGDAIGGYQKAKEEFYNQPVPNLSNIWYLVPLVIITLSEIAFNIIVFDVFGQSRLETMILAIGVMFAIPALSHSIGTRLRMENKPRTAITLMIIAALVVILGLLVIALLREKFLEANKVAETLGIKWSSEEKVYTFLMINILLFVAIVVLAYEAGHKDPDQYKRAKRAFEEASKALNGELRDVKEAVEKLSSGKIEFNKAHSERVHEFEKIKYRAEEERHIWVALVQLYRSSNMAARKDKTKPKSFLSNPEESIVVPESLQKPDCNNCDYPPSDNMREEK